MEIGLGTMVRQSMAEQILSDTCAVTMCRCETLYRCETMMYWDVVGWNVVKQLAQKYVKPGVMIRR
jgi:hypothetical protein